MERVMLLFDFAAELAIDGWTPINDVVMGGVSSGRLEATGNDTAAFTGLVSLEHGGGFASVRSPLHECDLRGTSGLVLRIRGDGRRYKINLKTDLRADGILYRAVFDSPDDAWRTVRLPFDEFLPTFRGRVVRGARPLDLSRVKSLGLMISDGQGGPFRLEIARIGAYRS